MPAEPVPATRRSTLVPLLASVGVPPVTALVPFRAPGTGKTRLADGLARDERAALAAAMLTDVAAALADAPLDRVLVAAAGRGAADAARELGLDVVVDPVDHAGLDAAIENIARTVDGTLVVVAADLPRLTGADVAAVLGPSTPVVIAPTTDGGTGGLVRRPPRIISTAYGPHSAHRHAELAAEAGVGATVVDVAGFRHDVDVWDDLRSLTPDAVGSATASFLMEFGHRLREPTEESR